MDSNPIIELLGRRLRLAVIGGGPGSFIGAMHRTAARLDDRYEIVAGVLSSDPQRSRSAATALGIDAGRAYGNVTELLDAEAGRSLQQHRPRSAPRWVAQVLCLACIQLCSKRLPARIFSHIGAVRFLARIYSTIAAIAEMLR